MDFKDKLSHFEKEINNIPNTAYNTEQKQLALDILRNANEDNLEAVYTFITQRVKLGFTFDVAPEVNHNAVSLIKRNEALSFGDTLGNNHKFIIGENYDALKNLLVTYTKNGKGLIDVIYIDPPYNTEKTKEEGNNYKDKVEAAKFVYRDKFTRNGWLNMMRERLIMARKLLADSGVIFISIDDTEQAYLKVLCDEIFGEENFVCTQVVISAPAGTQSSTDFAIQQSYCLTYRKTAGFHTDTLLLSDKDIKEKFKNKDDKGMFYIERLWKRGVGGRKEDVPSLHFPVYYDVEKNLIFIDDEVDNHTNLIKIIPYQTKDVLGRWTWSKEKMKRERDNLIVLKVADEYKLHKKVYFETGMGKKPCTIIDSALGRTELGSLEVKHIFDDKVFSYPKYSKFIKYLINLHPNKNAIVLDFFAGSGTTGQAVMELNAEDGGRRRCILVSNNENGIARDVAYERLYRVVKGKGTKGETFAWVYRKETPYLTGNYWDIFELFTTPLKIDDFSKAKELLKEANKEFKHLNPEYEVRDLNIYNELASLNPYKE